MTRAGIGMSAVIALSGFIRIGSAYGSTSTKAVEVAFSDAYGKPLRSRERAVIDASTAFLGEARDSDPLSVRNLLSLASEKLAASGSAMGLRVRLLTHAELASASHGGLIRCRRDFSSGLFANGDSPCSTDETPYIEPDLARDRLHVDAIMGLLFTPVACKDQPGGWYIRVLLALERTHGYPFAMTHRIDHYNDGCDGVADKWEDVAAPMLDELVSEALDGLMRGSLRETRAADRRTEDWVREHLPKPSGPDTAPPAAQ